MANEVNRVGLVVEPGTNNVCGEMKSGFRVVPSDRIEDLAKKLVAELKFERAAKGRFEFLKVSVANPNLGNWLKMKVLAKVPELCAGVEMPFLDEVLSSRVKASYTGGLELISGRDYPAVVLDVLMNKWKKEFVPFRKYVKESADAGDETTPLVVETQREARKAMQLADRLAQLIDGYEATGSLDLLRDSGGKNEVYRGELALVKALFGEGDEKGALAEKGRVSLRQMFEVVRKDKPKGAPVLRLFGQTMLTALQIDILAWLSKTNEVCWYFPGRVEGMNQEGRVKDLDPFHSAEDKTLRKLRKALGAEGLRLESVPSAARQTDGVLPRLQGYLGRENVAGSPIAQDASVQIIGVPGIRREVEMVYNAILGAVWEKNDAGNPVAKPGMSFSDIAVLVADMPTYRPMIEAVFDGRGQIPYGLVDVTTQDYSSYLDGFVALVNLARYGVSRGRLFAVLQNPCVQRAMGFSREEVVDWLELARKYGAFDGFEEKDSDEDNVSGRFNWSWALKRMRLGLVAQNLGMSKDGPADVLPLEADDADKVEKFSEVVETLCRRMKELGKMEKALCSSEDATKWPSTWAGRLHGVMSDFLAVERDDAVEAKVRSLIVRTLNGLSVIEGPQSYKLAVAAVEHSVAGVACAKGGYLRHGVTIGGLRSLAHVPFKQVFVIGLGEGLLPGQVDRSTLDVRNEVPTEAREDVLRPEENRARFLAAVLSARDRLVLSYSNRELAGDARLYPSSLVNDLKAACSGRVTSGPLEEFEGYPLVEFDGEQETPVGKVRSAIGSCETEDRFKGLQRTYSERAYILGGKAKDRGVQKGGAGTGEPTPKELAEFVKDPFTAVLKRRLGIATEGYRDHQIDESSPLGVPKGPTLWELQSEMLKGTFETAYKDAEKGSRVPTGFLSEFASSRLGDSVEWAKTAITEDERKILQMGEGTLERDVVGKKFDVGSRQDPLTIPPDACLQPLFARLEKASREGRHQPIDFSVKVVDVEARKKVTWRWKLSSDEAKDYYESAVNLFKEYLTEEREQSADGSVVRWRALDKSGTYPSVTYGELRNNLKTLGGEGPEEAVWETCADAIAIGHANAWEGGEKSFNSAPVIEKVVESFKREPTAEDLKNMYTTLFRVPMKGTQVKEGAVEGGAE